MHIKCGSCGTRYSLDAERIKGDSVTIKCPNCHKSMVVQKPHKAMPATSTHTVGPAPGQQKKPRKGKKTLNGSGSSSNLDLTIEDLAAFQDLDLSLLEDSGVFNVNLPIKDHDSLDLDDRVSYDFSDIDVSTLEDDGEPEGKVVTVEFEPPPGSYSAAQSVALSTRTPQAVIYYTRDGSEPTEESEGYLDPIDIVETTTIKAIAIKAGWETSDLSEAAYQITGKAGFVTFMPEPGEFAVETRLELSCATPHSVIYYTTDGKEPTAKSELYKKPIMIPEASELNIKARAYKEGWDPGEVSSGTYKVTGRVKEIAFSAEPGVYTTGIQVELSCRTPKAQIHYTVDGSEPSEKSTKYSKPISIDATSTVKARAFLMGWTPSDVLSGKFTITGKVKTPVFSPAPGAYPQPQQVTISCPDKEAAILFTTDGADPNENSPLFLEKLNITGPTVIKAFAYIPGWEPSDGVIAEYEITGRVAKPTFRPTAGAFDDKLDVHLECSTPGADIHYTLDGSEPSEKSTKFTTPIKLGESATLKARAYKAGWAPSEPADAIYKITRVVAGPGISPPGGKFSDRQTVTITCGASEAKIYYTLDGKEPTEKSQPYGKPFEINESGTIKARAFMKTGSPSPVVTADFTITRTVAVPTLSPSGGKFDKTQTVTLSCATADAVLYYTQDGSDPTEKSTKYAKPFEVEKTATIKAKAFKADWEPSKVVTGDFTITRTVASPALSPSGGKFDKTQTVTLSCATADAVLYYTQDGSDPTEKSTKYAKPFEVEKTATIKAKAFKADWEPSKVVTGDFTITRTVAVPALSPSGGKFDKTQTVTLSCATADAVLYYTLDGSDPTDKSPKYAKPFDVEKTATIKVKAFKTDWESSKVVTGEFTITRTVAVPALSPSGGKFDKTQTVTLSCETADAVLYYTLDGSDPTDKSTKYSKPFDVEKTAMVKAKAFKADWEPSPVGTGDFTITRTVALPTLSPSGGKFDKTQTVTLSCTTADAVLYYTLDGSDPTDKSPKYAKPFDVEKTAMVKAKAFKADWEPSKVVTGDFTITRTVALPTLSPSGGKFDKTQTVTLSCATADAVLYYTQDGSDPTEKSTKYAKPFDVEKTATIKAKAFKADWEPSKVVTGDFTITRTVASPALSPSGGKFDKTQTVTLSCATADAVLYYTQDGSDPTEKSTKYSKPFDVENSSLVKVRAFKDGWEPSKIVAAEFTIARTVAVPVISPAGGKFTDTQTVEISCATEDAAIHYTTDGSEPAEKSTWYSGSIEISESLILKTRAYKKDWTPSPIATSDFTITRTVAIPVISPSGGQFDLPQTVRLSCDTADSALHYTLDNTDPTESSAKYSDPVEIAETATLKVRAFKDGWTASDVATADFTITRTVAIPVISPSGGQFDLPQTVRLSCATDDSALHYTLDNSDPTESSAKYGDPVEVAETATIKARAFKDGWTASDVASADFTITRTVATPVISPSGGQFDLPQTVRLSCATDDSALHYTLDNSDPTESSPKYGDPVEIAETATIKVRAFKDGWTASDVASADFTIIRTVATPVISPSGGQFDLPQTVRLSCDTADSALHYTLDNSDPTESSAKYTDPVEIAATVTLKVKAFKDGWTPSEIATVEYKIAGKTAPPEFNPPPAEYADYVQVVLSSPTSDAVIHYTLNGTEPDESSPIYEDSIDILETTVVKAIALKQGWEPSEVVTGQFWISDADAPVHEEPQPSQDMASEEPVEPISEEEPEPAPPMEAAPEEPAEPISEEKPEPAPPVAAEPEEPKEAELPPWAKPAPPRDPGGRVVPFPKIALDGTAIETYVGKDGPEFGYQSLDLEGPPPSKTAPADKPVEPQEAVEPQIPQEPEVAKEPEIPEEPEIAVEPEIVEEPEEYEVPEVVKETVKPPVSRREPDEDVVDLAAYEDDEEEEEDTGVDIPIEAPEEDSVALGAYQSDQAEEFGEVHVEPFPDDKKIASTPFEPFEPPASEPELPPPPPEEPEVLEVTAEAELESRSAEELEAARIAEAEVKAAREAEKEAERAIKQAEKEAQKEAERKAKEEEKAAKEAEKESKRMAKEQARLLKPQRETNWRMIGIIIVVLVLAAVGAGLVLVLPSQLAKSEAKAAWAGYQKLKDLDDAIKAKISYVDYGRDVTRAGVEINKLKENPAYNELNEIVTMHEMVKKLWDALEFRNEEDLVTAMNRACPLVEKLAAAKDSRAQAEAIKAKAGCATGYYSGVFAETDKRDPRLDSADAAMKMLWAHTSERLEKFAKLNKPE